MTRTRAKGHTCDQCGRRFSEQNPYVLHLLEHAGPSGLHSFELRRLFIGNPSQRIIELEESGYLIGHRRERLNGTAVGTRYTLVAGSEPSPPSPVGTVGGADGPGHKNPWRQVFMCPTCAYREVTGDTCQRGHQAVPGWSADFTRPVELAEAA